ncbi:MAG: hypothetical protein ACYC4K_05950 [Thiobacillus sp.]
MVKVLWVLSMWFGLVCAAHAALEVKLDKSQSQLGEPLLLQIKSPADLNGLDLSPITQHFDIASQTLNRADAQGREQFLLEATLYPLRSGRLTIPKLTLGSEHSRQLSIQILPASVSMQAWFPAHLPMEREATVLHLEIRDDGNLSWDTPFQVDVPYATVRALQERTSEELQNDLKRVVHHFSWQVLPLKEGNLTVNFGLLDAHRYAQRLRFSMSPVSLKVRAAPAYLPLNLPIGKPVIRMDPRPHTIFAGKPVSWNIYVHSPGLSAEGVKNLLQYNVPAGLRMYLPSITPIVMDGDEYLRVTLSFIADNTVRHFPALGLPYFDQQQQRIETLTLPVIPLQVRDVGRERLIMISVMSIALGLLIWLAWYAWNQWRRLQVKRSWLMQIQSAQTPVQLYAALTQDSPWRVHSTQNLPGQLTIDPSLFQEMDQLVFDSPHKQSLFHDHKNKWMRVIAKSRRGGYPTESYINPTNELT